MAGEKGRVVQTKSGTSLGSGDWKEFAGNGSGEWVGVSSTFTPTGEVVPVPDIYVHESYKEWGEQVIEWQTQCSVKIDDTGMECKLRRLFTGAGCEPDSVAKTDVTSGLKSAEERYGEDKTIMAAGDYNIGARSIQDPADKKLRIEACFMQTVDSRLRTIAYLTRQAGGQGSLLDWQIANVEVHKELRVGEYRGGLDVEDFGRENMKLLKKDVWREEAATQIWKTTFRRGFLVSKEDGSFYMSESGSPVGLDALCGWSVDANTFIHLPEGLWCSIDVYADPNIEGGAEDEPLGILRVQMGWMEDEEHMSSWTREFHELDGLRSATFSRAEFLDKLE